MQTNLGRSLERQLHEVAQRRLNELPKRVQPIFDAVCERHKGEPVETVIPHVREAIRRAELTSDDYETDVRRYAEAISRGDRIVFEASRIRW